MATKKKSKAARPRPEGKVLAIRVPLAVGTALKKHLKKEKVTLQEFLESAVRKAVKMEETKKPQPNP